MTKWLILGLLGAGAACGDDDSGPADSGPSIVPDTSVPTDTRPIDTAVVRPDTGPPEMCPAAPPFPPFRAVCTAETRECVAGAMTQAQFDACLVGQAMDCGPCLNLTIIECAAEMGCQMEFDCWYACLDMCGNDTACADTECRTLRTDFTTCLRGFQACQDAADVCYLPPGDGGMPDATVPDAGPTDTGVTPADTGVVEPDAGTPPADTGVVEPDAMAAPDAT